MTSAEVVAETADLAAEMKRRNPDLPITVEGSVVTIGRPEPKQGRAVPLSKEDEARLAATRLEAMATIFAYQSIGRHESAEVYGMAAEAAGIKLPEVVLIPTDVRARADVLMLEMDPAAGAEVLRWRRLEQTAEADGRLMGLKEMSRAMERVSKHSQTRMAYVLDPEAVGYRELLAFMAATGIPSATGGHAMSAQPFDRDAVAREAMGALIVLHQIEAFERKETRAEAVMGIAMCAYELADAMEAARGVRDILKADTEAA